MNTVSTKSLNRLREQLGNSKLGVLPDVGKPHAKGYRYTVGQHADGSIARFWLGHNQTEAQHRADALLTTWARTITRNGHHWTPEMIKEARDFGEQKVQYLRNFVGGMRDTAALFDRYAAEQRQRVALTMPEAAAPSTIASSAVVTPSLYDGITAYLKMLDTKRVAPSHRSQSRFILDRMKAVRPDCPLAEVDHRWIDSLVDHFRSRPLGKTTGKPLRPETVVTTIRYIRTCFNWLDESGFGGWVGPRKLNRLFRVRRSDLMTPAELREAGTIKQFTVKDLVTLYKAGTAHQKAVMLTALFCGGTQIELASLTKAEFGLDAGILHHWRNKTKIEGRFWLPPELVTLLRTEFKKHPKSPLAFYTEEGNPLVTFDGDNRTSDAVQQSWTRQRENAGLPEALPFKYLRKFTGDYATRHGGEALGQVALSHAPTSVLAKSYTSARDFDGFNQIQKQMYTELKAAGMFKVAAKNTKQAKAVAA